MLTINLKSLQMFADSSSHGGGGGGSSMHQQQTPSTPSGVTVDQFRAMSAQEQVDTVNRILADPNIVVPAYLDGSETSKVMYALGMNNQMTVVSEDQLNQMSGRELFRTVYDAPNGMTAGDILNQVKSGEYTQLSGAGGSAHGRALYFATNFGESASYAAYGSSV